MVAAANPPREQQRLAALHALNILDTDDEERFDRITRLAQRLFGSAIATVSLVDTDRQWFKSRQGLSDHETPRRDSFCAHAILDTKTMVVGDATRDSRFADNPLVTGAPHIRFYAGHPISAPGGEPLGTLCVIDDEPRDATDFDDATLRDLAEMVELEVASLSLAIGDELTGLSNRRGFEMLGEKLVAAAGRLDLPVTVLYADLDNMKPINDQFGHEAGDRALAEIAALLESSLRGSDLIARLGGDEFCALLVGTEATGARSAVTRIGGVILSRNANREEPFELSLSIGLADSLGAEVDLWKLVGEADRRMFEIKREKKRG